MTWKEEVQKIVQKGCTNSDIEDFVEAHPELIQKSTEKIFGIFCTS